MWYVTFGDWLFFTQYNALEIHPSWLFFYDGGVIRGVDVAWFVSSESHQDCRGCPMGGGCFRHGDKE